MRAHNARSAAPSPAHPAVSGAVVALVVASTQGPAQGGVGSGGCAVGVSEPVGWGEDGEFVVDVYGPAAVVDGVVVVSA